MGCVYMATNTVNGKKYIGQTWDFERRKSEHRSCSKKYPFIQALKKYGRDAFVWTILVDGILTADELNRSEAEMIRRHRTLAPRGYNLLAGDQKERRVGVAKENHLSAIRRMVTAPGWKEKHAEQLRKMHASPEWRKRHDAAMARNPSDPHWRLKHAEMVARMCKAVICVETGQSFKSARDAGSRNRIDGSSIIAVCRGRRKTAGGHHWRYAA